MVGLITVVLVAILAVASFAWVASEAADVGTKYSRKVGPPAMVGAVAGCIALGFLTSGLFLVPAILGGAICVGTLLRLRQKGRLFTDIDYEVGREFEEIDTLHERLDRLHETIDEVRGQSAEADEAFEQAMRRQEEEGPTFRPRMQPVPNPHMAT